MRGLALTKSEIAKRISVDKKEIEAVLNGGSDVSSPLHGKRIESRRLEN